MRFVDEILAIGITQSVVAIVVLFTIWEVDNSEHGGESRGSVGTIGWERRRCWHITLI
jgi:hypothetical protein